MMKQANKIIFTSILLMLAAFIVVLSVSCKRDKCKSVTCNNGGSCYNGTCKCMIGYEGTSCQTLSRDKFIRVWGVENLTASATEPAQFSLTIATGTGYNYVTIKNLHNYFTSPVSAYVSGDSLIIPVQSVMGMTVMGGGYIYSSSVYGVNNVISFGYQVTDNTTHKTYSESEEWHG